MPRSSAPATRTIARLAGRDSVTFPKMKAELQQPGRATKQRVVGLEPLLLGSDPGCELVCTDPLVSRSHCQLMLEASGVLLTDLSSKNGTFVSGVRVYSALLTEAAEIRVGQSVLSLRVEDEATEVPLHSKPFFGEAQGASIPMRALFATLARAASTEEPVLLWGESGTGKELLARGIHTGSRRAHGPFVVLDCSALSPSLAEAELFGHEPGAFTGASTSRAGLLEQAHGGTIFLDEVGELPVEIQPKLLRAMDTHEIRRLGGTELQAMNVRVVAATHRDLRGRVASGQFREDLLYRLAVVEATVPPLRNRKEDIPLLVEQILGALDPPRTLDQLPRNALDLLRAHGWPGNVRELRNTVTRWALFPELAGGTLQLHATASKAPFGHLPLREAREAAVAEFERSYLSTKLQEHGRNVSATARALGVSRQLLHRLLARHDLTGGTEE